MGLAQTIFNSIKEKYFSVWDIISLIEQKPNNDLFDIGLFLGHINIEEHISIYIRDKFYNLHEVDLNYNGNPLGEIIDCLMDIMPFDSDEEQQKGRMKVRSKADMLFFSKQDIYNFKPIMDLGIIEGFNEQIAEPLYREPTQAYAEFEKINASLELDLAIEKNKVEKLNEEVDHLKAEIAKLEAAQAVQQDCLLSQIFDESTTERYAPDLALSIKLWEHIYITHPKSDSHSNKAIKWLENNTGYEVNKKTGSASKIREITTPFLNWGNLRDKNYKK